LIIAKDTYRVREYKIRIKIFSLDEDCIQTLKDYIDQASLSLALAIELDTEILVKNLPNNFEIAEKPTEVLCTEYGRVRRLHFDPQEQRAATADG
jgi:hypothetical protein